MKIYKSMTRTMDKKILYRKAYRVLDKSTPLRFDCGLLCNSRCCSGDSDEGMHLYPGEEIMFKFDKAVTPPSLSSLATPSALLSSLLPLSSPNKDKFKCDLKIKDIIFHDLKIKFLVCDGKCERRYRPLACRIFPLVPYISEEGILHIVEDPRAKYICPLIFLNMSEQIDKIFRRNLYKVFRLLTQDKDIHEYISCLSDTIRDYSTFTGIELP